jgi:hypothetical protein
LPQDFTPTLLSRLERFLITPAGEAASVPVRFWLGLSLLFSIGYALLALQHAFTGPYVVQDDARQHVFWMQRFLDPELFPHDIIADYFESIAPLGYTTLYRLAALVGFDPLLFNKLLPMPLGLITTAYLFGISMRLLPAPAAGFVATLLLNQSLWAKDDLVSATPRAFFAPLFLMFLYYLLRGLLLPCLLAIALQGLFYPSTVFLSVGILVVRLLDWERGWPRLSRDRHKYLYCVTGVAVAASVMGLFSFKTSGFGPVMSVIAAKALPEFFPGGRAEFFKDSSWEFWIFGRRSGLRPYSIFSPRIMLIGLLLPFLLYWSRIPLRTAVTRGIRLLPEVILVSLGMFVVAHLVLFKLYFPSRYTQYSPRVVMALAAGIALTLIVDALLHRSRAPSVLRPSLRKGVATGVVALIGLLLVAGPKFEKGFPSPRYIVGGVPSLYEFFSRQPKEIVIASLSDEANNLPTFSKRSILVGREYALPYHMGYYSKLRRRIIDLINAQYTPDLRQVHQFIRQYHVSFFLVDRGAFTAEYVADPNGWLWQFQPVAADAIAQLKQGVTPALAQLVPHCSVFQAGQLVVVDATCVLGSEG